MKKIKVGLLVFCLVFKLVMFFIFQQVKLVSEEFLYYYSRDGLVHFMNFIKQ